MDLAIAPAQSSAKRLRQSLAARLAALSGLITKFLGVETAAIRFERFRGICEAILTDFSRLATAIGHIFRIAREVAIPLRR